MYLKDEAKFIYDYVVVGHKAQARFKIVNSRMVGLIFKSI